MRTLVFDVPIDADEEHELLVTIYDDGKAEAAFRPKYGSWGPPHEPKVDER